MSATTTTRISTPPPTRWSKPPAAACINRALVHPDYNDYGPRLGLAYSIDPKTVVRGGYGISYTFFNRPGSAQEGINAPQALFGVLSQSNPRRAVPHFPHHAEQLYHQHRQPGGLQSGQFQRGLHSAGQQMAVHPELVLLGAAATSQGHGARCVLQREPQSAAADHRRLQSGGSEPAGPEPWRTRARVPIPTFGPITWLDPAGDNHYNGLSARVEHRFTKGLYILNSFTWGKAMGDSEQALEYYAGYYQANPQNIHNLAAEKGPSSFDVKLNNVTSVVYQLPFGKGRQFGANMNPVVDAFVGGWEINTINTAHTGTPLDVVYSADRGQHGQLAFERLSRPAVPAPQRNRQRRQPEPLGHAEHLFRRVHIHHAGRQRAIRQRGPQFVPRSQLRSVGLVRSTRISASAKGPGCNSGRSSSTF